MHAYIYSVMYILTAPLHRPILVQNHDTVIVHNIIQNAWLNVEPNKTYKCKMCMYA